MLSIPPATTISASPSIILCAACAIAFIPLAQTLFTVVTTSFGKPANFAACRAGACPSWPASHSPSKHPVPVQALIPAFSTAALIATAPNCVAEKSFNAPPKLPIGVLTAETI